MTAALLDARNISRTADDGTVLLDDVSLRVSVGSATAIVGPPGSGKTLLLRAIGLLDPLQAGEIHYRGRPIADHAVPDVRRQVLFVQQRPVLVEGTVRDNLRLPFSLGSDVTMRYDEPLVAELLSSINRDTAFLDRQTDDLSGGESQVVTLLRAIQLQPAVLLLDEPTSSLDAQTTSAIERVIARWKQADSERALVIVTHRPDQADRLSERRVTIRDGRIIRAAEAVDEPA